MTKGELLRILEPFTDELRIFIDTGEDELLSFDRTRYSMTRDGEGILRLCVMSELNFEGEEQPK